MAQYQMREGQTGTADAWTTLAGDGAGGTRNDITVPSGCKAIKQIIAIAACGSTAGASTYGLKLLGNGLVGTATHEFALASSVLGAGTLTDCNLIRPLVLDVDIPVQANNQIQVQAAMSGADQGTPEVAVALVFA